ncbi:MAG: sigma-70 family RNA polymerase sigma factor [Oscillospiraceae bacterium]|nr:sigma-70 family RNA polymerase sigma factor [Oscillospiraceae bacterium]
MFTTLLSFVLSKMLLFALHIESRTLPKPLTRKEEKEEFEKYHSGDMSARDRLIKHNLRLVTHVAKKYYNNPQDNEDIISIGTIGLIKAVQSFTYDKNTRFSTFASKCIENEILMSFRKQKGNENIIYLDDNLDVNNDSSNLSLKDSIQDEFETDVWVESQETRQEIAQLVFNCLSGRERQVIILRYGLGGNAPMTQQQVCEILGISRSYVSRIETKAINILRDNIKK